MNEIGIVETGNCERCLVTKKYYFQKFNRNLSQGIALIIFVELFVFIFLISVKEFLNDTSEIRVVAVGLEIAYLCL